MKLLSNLLLSLLCLVSAGSCVAKTKHVYTKAEIQAEINKVLEWNKSLPQQISEEIEQLKYSYADNTLFINFRDLDSYAKDVKKDDYDKGQKEFLLQDYCNGNDKLFLAGVSISYQYVDKNYVPTGGVVVNLKDCK